jgi:hypothetical protein
MKQREVNAWGCVVREGDRRGVVCPAEVNSPLHALQKRPCSYVSTCMQIGNNGVPSVSMLTMFTYRPRRVPPLAWSIIAVVMLW